MVASARGGITSGSGSHTRTDVHLHLDVSPPELTAHADPERIHQVVANLIDNAVKHSPPHGRVTVKARRGPQPESLELEVLDEGPGIPRSEWRRVFERFNRGEVTSCGCLDRKPARRRAGRAGAGGGAAAVSALQALGLILEGQGPWFEGRVAGRMGEALWFSSAEELAAYVCRRLVEALPRLAERGVAAVEVGVAEAPQQEAKCRLAL